MTRWLPQASWFGALLILTIAVGCPASPPRSDTPPADGDPVPATDGPAAPTDGVYRFPINTPIPTLDPAHVTDTVSSSVVGQLFDGLVKITPDGELATNLAERYEVSPDGLMYTFTLRTGVKFHNGREVTAEDVAYSFDRVLSPDTASPKSLFLDPIAGAKERLAGTARSVRGLAVKDAQTIEITLADSNALFPWYLAQSTCAIVPREAVESPEMEWSNHPVGTGPFKLGPETYNFNEGVTLVANPDYFGGAPALQGIRYIVEREEKKRFEGFRAGLYEHTDIPADEIDGVLGDAGLKAMLAERPTFDLYNIAFNCDKAPFKDNPTLRQAFNYAIDKEHIANTLLKGTRVVATSFLPNDFPNYTVPHEAYPYNPTRATELLEAAGYPNGEGLPPIRLWCNTDETHARIMEAVQADLAKVGVSVELRTLEWASFLAAMDEGQHDMGQATWLMDYPDPDNILYVLFHSRNKGPAGNQAFFGHPDVDRLVEQAQVIPDQAERMALYQEAESILHAESPWLLLLNRKCMILQQPYVSGLQLTTLDRAPVIPGVEMESVAFR